MIKKNMRYNQDMWNFSHIIEVDIKNQESLIGRAMTKDEVIEHLFGTHLGRSTTDLDLYLFRAPDTNWKHRLNRLWAYPLTLVLAPFRYVIYGDIGWGNKTKLGKFILVACGYDKDGVDD